MTSSAPTTPVDAWEERFDHQMLAMIAFIGLR
jgi:hypothetical protein